MTIPQLIEVDSRSTGESQPTWFSETSPAATGYFAIKEARISSPPARGTGGSYQISASISHAQSTGEIAAGAQIRSISSLKLEKLVSFERNSTDIDEECVGYADAAVREAISVIRRHNLSSAENIMMSQDGILSIQWRRRDRGAAMAFTGDGMVAISVAGRAWKALL
ncbi:hypothetical protein ABIF33_003540 [Bradyrhizobium elkanii]|uniref:hypothetical protein n=1 Tax=Bradyrhizobium elkanii TaxID=29448 RepID=UPI00351202C9